MDRAAICMFPSQSYQGDNNKLIAWQTASVVRHSANYGLLYFLKGSFMRD
jgi:hypothetical protein